MRRLHKPGAAPLPSCGPWRVLRARRPNAPRPRLWHQTGPPPSYPAPLGGPPGFCPAPLGGPPASFPWDTVTWGGGLGLRSNHHEDHGCVAASRLILRSFPILFHQAPFLAFGPRRPSRRRIRLLASVVVPEAALEGAPGNRLGALGAPHPGQLSPEHL